LLIDHCFKNSSSLDNDIFPQPAADLVFAFKENVHHQNANRPAIALAGLESCFTVQT